MASANYKKSVQIVKANQANLAKEALRRSYSISLDLMDTPNSLSSLSLIDYNALCIAIIRRDQLEHQKKSEYVEVNKDLFMTPPQSGESSTVASGSTSPIPQVEESIATSPASTSTTSPISSTDKPGMTHLVDFVFVKGATNATHQPNKTVKIPLENGSFELVVDPESDVPAKKMKTFTQEELKHQEDLVNEWREKIQITLQH